MHTRDHARNNDSTADEMAELFTRCEFARLLGIQVLELWPGGAKVAMDITDKRNPLGNVHGGAVFSLADHAFGLAANSGGIQEVALSAQITYISPSTGRLVAVAERISENKDGSVVSVRVWDGERLVATFEGIGIRLAQGKKGRDK
jgi:acyl-CoA thioesterase